ncbi:hypothetical protein SGQ44_16795 [Flavobacterium sp. Fl-77]|uniref:Uncharacterized protein n=1 Tax=Flavobacterium flavipigmentatum TaxID=2893884 RepID=A0AAJ2W2J2_9FLAO|nr:hypothetical protein [Flavobacterium sp. Fl-77]MDX6187420.1 hypothetical protein [Flavobacterium sp. Fl-77]
MERENGSEKLIFILKPKALAQMGAASFCFFLKKNKRYSGQLEIAPDNYPGK